MAGPDDHGQATGHPPSDTGDASTERQRRLEALRGLAEHADPAPAGSLQPKAPRPSLAPPAYRRRLTQHTRNRWLVAISAALCTAVLAVLVLSHLSAAPASKKAGQPTVPPHAGLLTLQVANDGFSCVQDVAWDPNSGRIAVLGYSVCRGKNANTHGHLVVYAATTGVAGTKLDLDALVTPQLQQAVGGDASAGANLADLTINYDHVLWSTDSRALDVTFTVSDDRQPNRYAVFFGFLHDFFTGSAGEPEISLYVAPAPATLSYAIWNYTGALTTAPYDQSPLFSLRPWEAYTWFPPGASIPAPTTSSRFEPVGDPASGGKFTIWQPGTLSLHAPHDTSGNPIPPPIYSYTTSFAAQSQAVLVDPVTSTFRLQPAGESAPSAQTLRTFGLDQAPVFPTRDKALDAVLAGFKLTSNASAPSSPMALARRLDGTRLAAKSGAPSSGPGGTRDTVTIYDSASGAVITHLTTTVGSSSAYSYLATSLLRWSPDGTQLALYDTNLNTISVWSTPLLSA